MRLPRRPNATAESTTIKSTVVKSGCWRSSPPTTPRTKTQRFRFTIGNGMPLFCSAPTILLCSSSHCCLLYLGLILLSLLAKPHTYSEEVASMPANPHSSNVLQGAFLENLYARPCITHSALARICCVLAVCVCPERAGIRSPPSLYLH